MPINCSQAHITDRVQQHVTTGILLDSRYWHGVVLPLCSFLTTGCQQHSTGLNAPPQEGQQGCRSWSALTLPFSLPQAANSTQQGLLLHCRRGNRPAEAGQLCRGSGGRVPAPSCAGSAPPSAESAGPGATAAVALHPCCPATAV